MAKKNYEQRNEKWKAKKAARKVLHEAKRAKEQEENEERKQGESIRQSLNLVRMLVQSRKLGCVVCGLSLVLAELALGPRRAGHMWFWDPIRSEVSFRSGLHREL